MLEKKIEELSAELTQLKKLKDKYPDIREDYDRWRTKRYSSKSVNAVANKVDSRHSCGCCSDPAFLVMPYVEEDGVRIYSDPTSICVGEKSTSYYGEVWSDNWQGILAEKGISDTVIKLLEKQYERDEKKRAAYENYQQVLDELD